MNVVGELKPKGAAAASRLSLRQHDFLVNSSAAWNVHRFADQKSRKYIGE